MQENQKQFSPLFWVTPEIEEKTGLRRFTGRNNDGFIVTAFFPFLLDFVCSVRSLSKPFFLSAGFDYITEKWQNALQKTEEVRFYVG